MPLPPGILGNPSLSTGGPGGRGGGGSVIFFNREVPPLAVHRHLETLIERSPASSARTDLRRPSTSMGREQFPAAVAPLLRRSRSGSNPALRFGIQRPCRHDQRDRKDGNSCTTTFLDWRSGVRAPRTATPSKMRPRTAHGGNHGHGRWHTACKGKNMAESVRHPEVFKSGEP